MLPPFFAKNFKEVQIPQRNISIYIMLEDLYEILILYLIKRRQARDGLTKISWHPKIKR
jgi:hypothetical protein